MKKQHIVCAAIRKDDIIICAARHFDPVMHRVIAMADCILGFWVDAEQGFIDQYGEFLTREQAYQIALDNGQITLPLRHKLTQLFSEDLY